MTALREINIKLRHAVHLFLAVFTLVVMGTLPHQARGSAQTTIYTGFSSFFLATGPLTEIDFENLPAPAASEPDPVVEEFIPNSLTMYGVTFTDLYKLETGFCSLPTCQPDPHNPSGGNVVLALNPGATVDFPVGTGGALFVIEGMETVTFTLQVTDFEETSITVDGQAILSQAVYLGFTSDSGIRQIEVVGVGSSGGPLGLSTVFVELADPEVTIGVWADPSGDVGPANADLVSGSATVEDGLVDLRVQFLEPPFSSCEAHDVTWCFNVDGDAATGSECGYPGADIQFTLSGESGSLFGGPFSFSGALAGLDPCSTGSFNWDTFTLRLVFPRSLLSSDGTIDYVVEGAFGQKDESNIVQVYEDTAPDGLDFGAEKGFFTVVEERFAPFDGVALCLPYQEASVPIEALGTVRRFPELGTTCPGGVANAMQSYYFKTTDLNREFRRGFVEFMIPALPEDVRLSHAALILPETRGWSGSPRPAVTHEVSYYYAADLAINIDDYDRATVPVSQTFETDASLPPETFSIDVTDAFSDDHQGEPAGIRVKLALDPTYSSMNDFGTTFDASTDIPPRIVIRLSDARANVDPVAGGTLIHSDTLGAETWVTVPAGAVSTITRLTYDEDEALPRASGALLREQTCSTSSSLVRTDYEFVLNAYQGGRQWSGSVFQEPVIVTMHYTDAQVAQVNKATLILTRWDGAEWEYAACGLYDRHPEANWLAVPICQTGEFVLSGLPADVSIEGLTAANDGPAVLGRATALSAAVTAGSNVNYAWAFGDGTSGSGPVVSHTYLAAGSYTAVVTASNRVGEQTATTSVRVVVRIYVPILMRDVGAG